MMKKTLIVTGCVALAGLPLAAQKLSSGYLSWPESNKLHTYVEQWNGGNGKIQINGQEWEDEYFFVSRVKPKVRFNNSKTQVHPEITQWSVDNPNGNDKRLIAWVPIGEQSRGDIQLNSLADGVFDGEVFNMWSYIDHWGNWTSPFGWVPGNFADVAHKNGVAVSGVASVPESMSADWQNCLNGVVSVGKDKLGQWLYYHGVDGLGYNSEWTNMWSPKSRGLTDLHNGLYAYMAENDRDPIFENIWYGGVTDNGARTFDVGIQTSQEIYKGASMFLNYNWNNTTLMNNSINISKNAGKSPFYIYAGMNQQGGEPKNGSNYDLLKDYQYSIGLWGAHSVNMLWETRYSNGSSDEAKIKTYIKSVEQWYGNGPRNPAIKLTPTLNRTHRPHDDWAGMSSMMSERSSLSWDINAEPFYTFFNIGNGMFFNWKGERMNNNQWHNIGVQDYQPTWHYWFAPKFCQTDVQKGDVSLNADVTWEDAYVGGSCLKLTGSAAEEYLHLFKTQFNIASDFELVVSYRLIDGSANIELALGSSSNPSNNVAAGKYQLFKATSCEDLADKCFVEGWQTVRFPLKDIVSGNNFDLGLIGLKITDAKNLNLLIGQLSIVPSKDFAAPEKPVLKVQKKLAYNISGVDGKLIWDMPNNKKAGEPCYNIDVKTSMFQLWSQQEGEDEVFMGLTTSWAGFVFGAPVNREGSKKIRFGVSALSLDTEKSSDIAWSNYFDLNDYVTIDEIQIDKKVIKPFEKFNLSFIDPAHQAATWTITDGTGKTVWEKNGVAVECSEGLEEIGGYNLIVKYGQVSQEYPYYITISSEKAGALPEIYTLSIGDNDVTDSDEAVKFVMNETKEFSYTGRKADGSSSRGVNLDENWFGVACKELGLTKNKSFSVAAWVRYDELPTGRSNFITIEDRIGGGWPYDNWGYFWSRINDKGGFVDTNIDTTWGFRTQGNNTEGGRIFYRYDDAKIEVGIWTHVAITFEYEGDTNKMRSEFYINGRKQEVSYWLAGIKGDIERVINQTAGGDWSQLEKAAGVASAYGTGEPDFIAHNYPVDAKDMWIAFGGTSQNISAVKGCVDDFQIWGKAMTADDVQASMKGLDVNSLPAEILGFWDFENSADSNQAFIGYSGSSATNASPKAYLYSIPSTGENNNKRQFQEARYLIGSPFIAGTAYPVVTTPTWETRRANIDGKGTDEEGTAKITWTKPGDYTVRLKLSNAHGEATMDYPVITIEDDGTGVEEITTEGGFATYTIDDALFVEFKADGNYDVEVYAMNGTLINKKAANVQAGQNMQISIATPGIYLVKVVRDGKLLRTVKVVRK